MLWVLKELIEIGEIPTAEMAVRNAVIGRKGCIDDRARNDLILNHPGTLNDAAKANNRGLWWDDDGADHLHTPIAKARDSNRAVGKFRTAKRACACTLHEIL